MPGKAAINARLTNGHVQSNYLGLVRTHLTTLSADKLSETLIQRTSFTTEQRAHIAVAIESRFLQGSRRVLRRYGQASEADWPRMAGSRS
jgi:hypothetical protein